MDASNLLKPRFIIGLSGLGVAVYLASSGIISGEASAAIVVGILIAFGAYYMESPRGE